MSLNRRVVELTTKPFVPTSTEKRLFPSTLPTLCSQAGVQSLLLLLHFLFLFLPWNSRLNQYHRYSSHLPKHHFWSQCGVADRHWEVELFAQIHCHPPFTSRNQEHWHCSPFGGIYSFAFSWALGPFLACWMAPVTSLSPSPRHRLYRLPEQLNVHACWTCMLYFKPPLEAVKSVAMIGKLIQACSSFQESAQLTHIVQRCCYPVNPLPRGTNLNLNWMFNLNQM